MIKSIYIPSLSLSETGHKAEGRFSNDRVNIITTVDGKKLAEDIDKASNELLRKGYTILSVAPITSSALKGHSLQYQYTSGVVITALQKSN